MKNKIQYKVQNKKQNRIQNRIQNQKNQKKQNLNKRNQSNSIKWKSVMNLNPILIHLISQSALKIKKA